MADEVSIREKVAKVIKDAESVWLNTTDTRLLRDVIIEAILDRFDIKEKEKP